MGGILLTRLPSSAASAVSPLSASVSTPWDSVIIQSASVVKCVRRRWREPFFEHEGGIYCEQHYYKMLGLLCPECEKPIFGKCVNARGVRYHPDCFKCEFCKKPLAGLAFYVHNDRPYDRNGDDLKGGRAKGEGLGVRLVRPALAVADSDLDLVLARAKVLHLVGGGLELETDVVVADRELTEDLGVTEREALRRRRLHDQLDHTGTGLRGHADDRRDVKGRATVALQRDNTAVGDVGGGVVVDGADVQLLAIVDRVKVAVVNNLDELLNADVVAQKVADGALEVGVEETAEIAAGVQHTELGDGLDELTVGLVEPGHAERAGLLLVRSRGGGEDGEKEDGEGNELHDGFLRRIYLESH